MVDDFGTAQYIIEECTMTKRMWAGLAAGLGMMLVGTTASAWDDGVKPLHKHQWPSMYSRLNYWAPNVYRIHAYMQPIGPYIMPVNTTPDIVPQYKTWNYRMPPVSPAAQPYYPNIGPPLTTVAP